MIKTLCFVARGTIKENKKVIGIATEMRIKPSCSYDFCVLDLPTWTEAEDKHMKIIQEKTGVFLNPELNFVHEDEYPKTTGH